MTDAFAAADRFLLNNARLLERRLFATCFLSQPGQHVVDALRGYQNDDGGFGHALEPDVRCPASLPIHVEIAFQALATAGTVDTGTVDTGTVDTGTVDTGTVDGDMVVRACEFLARTADEAGAGGAVPLAFPVIEKFPRAVHWSEWTYQPDLNPTAGLVGLLYQLGVDHPWREAGAVWCWQQLDAGNLPSEAHAMKETLVFLEHTPERERADKHAAALVANLADVSMFHFDPDTPGYGLTPLDLAPLATSRWRSLFPAEVIEGHLDGLARAQQEDGGWPISWDPPGDGASCEWRGVVTLAALRTLTSYGRLKADV